MNKVAVIGVALALLSSPASAAPTEMWGRADDGNKLRAFCQEEDGSREVFYCLGYLSAAVDGIDLLTKVLKSTALCVPSNVTLGQMKDVFLLYTQRHPEKRGETGTVLMGTAMIEAWPCQK